MKIKAKVHSPWSKVRFEYIMVIADDTMKMNVNSIVSAILGGKEPLLLKGVLWTELQSENEIDFIFCCFTGMKWPLGHLKEGSISAFSSNPDAVHYPSTKRNFQQTYHLQQPRDFFPPSNTLLITVTLLSDTLSDASFFTSTNWKPVFVFVSMLSRTFSAMSQHFSSHEPMDLNSSATPIPVIALVSTYIRFAFLQNASISYSSPTTTFNTSWLTCLCSFMSLLFPAITITINN